MTEAVLESKDVDSNLSNSDNAMNSSNLVSNVVPISIIDKLNLNSNLSMSDNMQPVNIDSHQNPPIPKVTITNDIYLRNLKGY